MRTSDTIDKSLVLKPSEDYNFLRREGIKHIEKMGGDLWTDFNTHDPGITLLESLCYAITDLAYRTGFDMKDLLAKPGAGKDAWENIFYTAREILPGNPVTINDYRKLLMDIKGVRNAWITISKDVEVPVFLNQSAIRSIVENPIRDKETNELINTCGCGDKLRFPYNVPDDTVAAGDEVVVKGLVYMYDIEAGSEDKYKIIELNGLYKIILEYEEDIIEKKQENEVRKQALNVLHRNRNICEDYISVTGAEYKDFFLRATVFISENTDADLVLAQMCYQIQSYFTPAVKFYSLDEMEEMKIPVDVIFEGPALEHGFILDADLDKTDMFRDMRLSDIINFVSDIEGINALKIFKIVESKNDNQEPVPETDRCSNEEFFAQWIDRIKNEKLVGRLSIDDLLKYFHWTEEDSVKAISEVHFFKPSGEVKINTDRFEKLLNDLKGRDKYLKKKGFINNFKVPSGENMELEKFYPVQYQLPFTYRVGKNQMPLREGSLRLIQSLQLKGYFAVFEQIFLNYMYQLDNLNETLSFRDVKFKGKSKRKKEKSACDPEPEEENKSSEKEMPLLNEIVYYENNILKERIEGYKCLYYDAKRYLTELPGIIQTEADFEWQRNTILDHLLARFNESMDEYTELMKYMFPNDYLPRVIKNKTDLLADYTAISRDRGQGYNYDLTEEGIDYKKTTVDEDLIAVNISGLEKRIARLIGMKSYKRIDLSPGNLYIVAVGDKEIKIVLYEDRSLENILLETKPVRKKCADDIMHDFIDAGCCGDNFRSYPEKQQPERRIHQHQYKREFRFALLDKDGEEIARSPIYYSEKERDDALKLAKCSLERICQAEGFHMIEHLLLRPKGDTWLSDEHNKPLGDEFKLLDICIDKCDVLVQQDSKVKIDYKFELQVLPPEECRDGKRWRVTLIRLRSDDASVTPPVIILNATFKEYEGASAFISLVREYGSEWVNFNFYKSRKTGKYYFVLRNKNGKRIAESSCYEVLSTKRQEDVMTGGRTECDKIVTDKEMLDEVEALKDFFAYENDLYCCEEPCDHNEDPYSFRITFVLPCWPKRFRDKGFRKFVEKVIRDETPAHIHANIFWLGITEMRDYEEAYFNWTIEVASHDTPDITICNTLINQLINLKNCDQHCEEHSFAFTKTDRVK